MARVPLKPVQGHRYYLQHWESGLLVHPQGGSDTPANTTLLIWNAPPPGRLALEFVFEGDQIKQYSSGKYIHPRNGQVGDSVELVLHDGKDNHRTSIVLVEHEGRTYLKHDEYYVHPRGGSANPEYDTPLLWSPSYRPGVAIGIIPAEESQLIGITYLTADPQHLQTSPIVVETEVRNESDIAVSQDVSVQYNRSLVNTFSYSLSEKFGIKVANSLKTNFLIGSFETSIEVSFELGATQQKSETKTEGVQVSHSTKVEIPPHHAVKLSLTTQRTSGTIPFVAHFRTSSGINYDVNGKLDTEYFFDQTSTVTKIPCK